MQTVQETIATIIHEHGGPDAKEWLHEHDAGKPTDGDTLKIAYARDGKRMKQKTGRFVRAHLWPDVTDQTLQAVGAAIDAALFGTDTGDGDGPVKELRGEDIRDFYLNSGIRSCMSERHAQDYFDIYVDNPDVVCLLACRMANGAARALAWTFPDGARYLDREYHTSDSARDALEAYANKQGISRHIPGRKLDVDITNGIDSYWPYMDTFCSCDILDETRATLYAHDDGKYNLRQTDGTCGDDRYVCCACGNQLDEDDYESHDGDIYCSDCFSERYSYCDHCGEHDAIDCMSYLENLDITVCDHCRDNDFVQCDICGDWSRDCNSHALDTNDANLEHVCQDCYDEKIRTCATCDTDFRIDEGGEHTTPDGIHICEECFDEQYFRCDTCGAVHSKGIGCEDCDAKRMYGDALLSSQAETPEPIPSPVS